MKHKYSSKAVSLLKAKAGIALLLTAAMTAGLAACGSSDSAKSSTDSESSSAAGDTSSGKQESDSSPSPESGQEKTTSLTASGQKIRVDYSGYKAGSKKQANYTRRTDSSVTELPAADDYGMIYPFVGDILYEAPLEDYQGYTGIAGYLYGFADAAGEIICDPVYNDISILYYTDPDSGKTVSSGFYCLVKTEVPAYQEDAEEDYYYNYSSRCALASLDGSYVSECRYSDIAAFPSGFILYENSDYTKVTVIDRAGNVLFTEKDLSQVTSGSELWLNWSGKDNLFVLNDWDQELCYYIDETGKTVKGPYAGAGAFQNGMAIITENGRESVVDSEWNAIVKGTYGDFFYITCNYIMAQNDVQNTISFYDSTGKNLLTVNGAWSGNITEDLFLVDSDFDSDNGCYEESAYDHKGTLLATYDTATDSMAGKSPVLCHAEETAATLTNLLTGVADTLTGQGIWVDNISRLTGRAEDYDTDSRLLAVFSQESAISEDEYNFRYTYYDPDTLEMVYDAGTNSQLEYLCDQLNNDTYLLNCSGSCYYLLDDTYTVREVYNSYPAFYDGAVVLHDAEGSSIISADGEEIFYYPLVLTYDD